MSSHLRAVEDEVLWEISALTVFRVMAVDGKAAQQKAKITVEGDVVGPVSTWAVPEQVTTATRDGGKANGKGESKCQ